MAECCSTPSLKARYHTIDKLNGNNYQVWKLKMELYLKELQLWDVISTPAPSPVETEWMAKDNTTHMEIILHCGDRQVQTVWSVTSAQAIWSFFQKTYEHTDLVYQVSPIKRLMNTNIQEGQSATKFVNAWWALLDVTSAQAIWSFFQKTYEHTNLVYQVSPIKRLMNTNIQEGQSATKFVNAWWALLDEVIISGLAIPETLQTMILLAALPSSWRAFITTKTSSVDLQLQPLVAKIHEEEALRGQSMGAQPMAFATTIKPAKPCGNSSNRQGSFNNSKQPHRHPHSNFNHGGQQQYHGGKSNPHAHFQCNFYDKHGHLEKDCHEKKRNQASRGLVTSFIHQRLNAGNFSPYPQAQAHYTELSHYDGTSQPLLMPSNPPMQLYATFIGAPYTSANMWFLDTRATHHMTYHLEWLKNLTSLSIPLEVSFGDDSTQPAQAYGDVKITLPEGRKVIIPQVDYVPGLRKNLISVSELTDQGLKMEFSRHGCHIHARAPRQGKLYPLSKSSTSAHAFVTIDNTAMQIETLKWHYWLGNISQHALHEMKNRQLALGLPKQLTSISLCEGCIIGKATDKPFPNSLSRTSHPLALIHSDLCKPLPVQSLTGH
ncbi:hypothetical protein L7F22_035789 [Adiantum nelumboides]|nr:hypothetical protein [Adiantum nelumboides]